jgi:hypothetical protein
MLISEVENMKPGFIHSMLISEVENMKNFVLPQS